MRVKVKNQVGLRPTPMREGGIFHEKGTRIDLPVEEVAAAPWAYVPLSESGRLELKRFQRKQEKERQAELERRRKVLETSDDEDLDEDELDTEIEDDDDFEEAEEEITNPDTGEVEKKKVLRPKAKKKGKK